MGLREQIEAANQRAAGAKRKVFAKKASDAQMLDNLAEAARHVLALWPPAELGLLSDARQTAMKDLKTMVALAEKRAR